MIEFTLEIKTVKSNSDSANIYADESNRKFHSLNNVKIFAEQRLFSKVHNISNGRTYNIKLFDGGYCRFTKLFANLTDEEFIKLRHLNNESYDKNEALRNENDNLISNAMNFHYEMFWAFSDIEEYDYLNTDKFEKRFLNKCKELYLAQFKMYLEASIASRKLDKYRFELIKKYTELEED